VLGQYHLFEIDTIKYALRELIQDPGIQRSCLFLILKFWGFSGLKFLV